jgi:hypothetical protein
VQVLHPWLVACLRNDSERERLPMYAAACVEEALAQVEPVTELVSRDPAVAPRVASLGRWLVNEARHRAPVKLGIALLGACGG